MCIGDSRYSWNDSFTIESQDADMVGETAFHEKAGLFLNLGMM